MGNQKITRCTECGDSLTRENYFTLCLVEEVAQLKHEKAELNRLCERAYLVIDENYEKLSDGESGPLSLLKDLVKAKDGKELRDINLLNDVLAKQLSDLIERVKAHNEKVTTTDKHFPDWGWKTYLISLDAEEEGK